MKAVLIDKNGADALSLTVPLHLSERPNVIVMPDQKGEAFRVFAFSKLLHEPNVDIDLLINEYRESDVYVIPIDTAEGGTITYLVDPHYAEPEVLTPPEAVQILFTNGEPVPGDGDEEETYEGAEADGGTADAGEESSDTVAEQQGLQETTSDQASGEAAGVSPEAATTTPEGGPANPYVDPAYAAAVAEGQDEQITREITETGQEAGTVENPAAVVTETPEQGGEGN